MFEIYWDASWWFQPIWKILISQDGNLLPPQNKYIYINIFQTTTYNVVSEKAMVGFWFMVLLYRHSFREGWPQSTKTDFQEHQLDINPSSSKPIGSMYVICSYICHTNQANVAKYTIHGSTLHGSYPNWPESGEMTNSGDEPGMPPIFSSNALPSTDLLTFKFG